MPVWPMPGLMRTGLPGFLMVLGSSSVHAGLSLDDALNRSRQVGGLEPWSELIPAAPPQGLTMAVGGPERGTPQTVVSPAPGQNSMAAAFDLADSGRWQVRIGVGGREDGPRPWSFDGSAVKFSLDERVDHNELYASVERRHWGPGWRAA